MKIIKRTQETSIGENMKKVDLLQKVEKLYGNKTSDDDLKTYLDTYDELLNGNIDYEKLYKLIYENWEYSTLMPTPKFIKEQVSEAKIKSKKQKQKIYIYDCLILENQERLNLKEGQTFSGSQARLISLHNNGIKFKVIKASPFVN